MPNAQTISNPKFIPILTIGPYLIVCTKKEKVGEIRGNTIWRATETKLHSYKKTMLHLTEKQVSSLYYMCYYLLQTLMAVCLAQR